MSDVALVSATETSDRYVDPHSEGTHMVVDGYASVFGEETAGLIRRKAHRLAGRYGLTPSDVPDVSQELSMEMWRKLPKFDPRRGSRHGFVARIVNNRIADLVEHRQTQKRDYRREEFSVNEHLTDERGRCVERIAMLRAEHNDRTRARQDLVDLKLDLGEKLGLPADKQEPFLEAFFAGNVSQLARDLGVPRTTFYGRIQKMRQSLMDRCLADYER